MLLVCPDGSLRFSSPFDHVVLDVFSPITFESLGATAQAAIDLLDPLALAFGPRCDTRRTGPYLLVTKWGKACVPPHFQCRIAFCVGSPVAVLESLVSREQRFPAIHTGSAIDTCGLLNLFVQASPLLANNEANMRSLIYTSTEHLTSVAASRDDFVCRATGLPLEALPTLLGINYFERATDSDWASHVTRFTWSSEHVERRDDRAFEPFTFYKLDFPSVPVALKESPFLAGALIRCAEALRGPDRAAPLPSLGTSS
ncbi:hypothetical protein H9P43_009758 [Blastocladiella emersonii ATCC 22665]|nr:hypothetical protein H9P43_009758 [Blastocladiella emersonii ATCC 22665]